ncbi:MAG: hypothetical protein LBV01_06065 [Deltaproteobacteria bacterium]|jgi:hypothetical protein|nr:hypothetical protein [Deltaproteobacteria bacterium]
MTPDTIPTPAQPAGNIYASRDRVLLYTRGMSVNPIQGLDLALRSLRAAGENARPATVMEELYRILGEEGVYPEMKDASGAPLASAPPMNRRSMVAKDMDQLSLAGALVTLFRPLLAALRR